MGENRSKGSILCVDDNVEFCKLIVKFLLQRGYDVYPVLSAEEGYKIVKRYRIDMLILDLYMEAMGGIGLLEKLKGDKIEIPTLVITAYPKDIPILEMESFKVYEYFEKPVDLKLVHETIKKYFEKNM